MATTILLRVIRKVAIFSVPVAAVAGSVIAPEYSWTSVEGLVVGVLAPLSVALAIDEVLLRRTGREHDSDSPLGS